MKIVQDNKSLENLCKLLNKQKIIYLDTEFKRDNTYWPILCTVQIKTKKKEFLIDMLAQATFNLERLKKILQSKKILKVLHSAKQDIEVINYTLNINMINIFDTQITYNQLFGGETIGYTKLVEKLFKIKLSKKYQVSNWTIRPLTKEQLAYAQNDVYYLPKIYQILIEKLRKNKIVRYTKKNTYQQLNNINAYSLKKSYKRIKINKVTDMEKKKLKKYAEWRETYAQSINLPRNWIVSDKNLIRASKNKLVEIKKEKNNKDQKLNEFIKYISSLNP